MLYMLFASNTKKLPSHYSPVDLQVKHQFSNDFFLEFIDTKLMVGENKALLITILKKIL